MKTVYVFLADGFEEIEAFTPVDALRRAEIPVQTVGVTGKTVTGGHGIQVMADLDGSGFILPEDAAMVLLPGGGKGTANLAKSSMIAAILQSAKARDLLITAICAAPTVLHTQGLLDGKTVTAFPAEQSKLVQAHVTGAAVEVDGNIITGRSAGVALQFSHALITALAGGQTADEVIGNMYPEHVSYNTPAQLII